MKRRTIFASLFAMALAAGSFGMAAPALALDDLRIIAPAKPGGGWDQTARSLSEVMAGMGAKGGTVENVPGAGGAVGLAQLVDQEKGKRQCSDGERPRHAGCHSHQQVGGHARHDNADCAPHGRI